MSTYAEKLKDPRWQRFREDFINRNRRRCNPEGSPQCIDCGDATIGPLHVHHRRYIAGRDPWDYDDDDLLLICERCHDRIHLVENRMRDFIRHCRPHECCDISDLLDLLERAKQFSVKCAIARARSAVADFIVGQEAPEGDTSLRAHLDKLMRTYG